MVRVGCITLPFSGDFNTVFIFTGFAFAILCVCIAVNLVTPKGPAIAAGSPAEIVDALGKTMIAQVVWCIIYYNYVGAAVLCVFTTGPWELIDATKQTDKWSAQVGRFSANQFEQSVVFIPCLWMYAVLIDSETAGALGILYCIQRAIYPFFYVIQGRFTFLFEHITQVGYAINGTFMLGCLMKGFGYNYIEVAKENTILIPVLGTAIGVFTLLPGVGITLPWFALHTSFDRARKNMDKPLASAE